MCVILWFSYVQYLFGLKYTYIQTIIIHFYYNNTLSLTSFILNLQMFMISMHKFNIIMFLIKFCIGLKL